MSGKGNISELKRTIHEIDHEIYNIDNLEDVLKRGLHRFNKRKKKKR